MSVAMADALAGTALELMQDVKWDNCKPPYSPGNCTPDPFSGGHNYTGWCGDKACPVNSKEGVGKNFNVSATLVCSTNLSCSAAACRIDSTEEEGLKFNRLIEFGGCRLGATVAAALNDGGIDYNCGPL
jgi:hypothetical protein